MKRFLKLLKWTGLGLLAMFVILATFNVKLLTYGFSQLKGQLKIVYLARPIVEIMKDSLVSDSIKQKFIFIDEVKRFAIDSLGLKESDNYTTYFDQHNKPLLWVITASDAYSLSAYHWTFPFLGSVSYKGFFEYDKGLEEVQQLKSEGYDTDYSTVSAWSTLGWFKDPILSNMLKREKGRIAELIIHEMTHATLYIKSNVNFNENLASVCGEQGAIHFLKSKYGIESPELKEYIFSKEDYDRFSNHMLSGTKKLDSVYTALKDSIILIKKKGKDLVISEIVNSLDTIHFHSSVKYKQLFRENLPNNAYFLDFIRYDAQKDEMKMELDNKFGGNIKLYLDDLRKRY